MQFVENDGRKLEEYDASEWLDINTDKKRNVISLKCKVCNTYYNIIQSIKKCSRLWAVERSTNLRHNNV